MPISPLILLNAERQAGKLLIPTVKVSLSDSATEDRLRGEHSNH